MDRVRFRVIVHGRVQGVWYRDSCRREATKLGVDGWVRNRMDGTVEVVAEGDEPSVARLVSWCRQGPPRAEVDSIDVTEEDARKLHGFQIR